MPIIKPFDVADFVLRNQGLIDNPSVDMIPDIIKAQPVLTYAIYIALPIVTMVLSCFYCCGMRCCCITCTAEYKAQNERRKIKTLTKNPECAVIPEDREQQSSVQRRMVAAQANYARYRASANRNMGCHMVCYFLYLLYGIIAIVGIALLISGMRTLCETDQVNKMAQLPQMFINDMKPILRSTDNVFNALRLKNGTADAKDILTKAIYSPDTEFSAAKSVLQSMFPDGIRIVSEDLPKSVNAMVEEIIGSVAVFLTGPDLTQSQKDLIANKVDNHVYPAARELWKLLKTRNEQIAKYLTPVLDYLVGDNHGDLPKLLSAVSVMMEAFQPEIAEQIAFSAAYLSANGVSLNNMLLSVNLTQEQADIAMEILESIKDVDVKALFAAAMPQDALADLTAELQALADAMNAPDGQFEAILAYAQTGLLALQQLGTLTFAELLAFVDEDTHPLPRALQTVLEMDIPDVEKTINYAITKIDEFKASLTGQSSIITKYNAATNKLRVAYVIRALYVFFIACVICCSLALLVQCSGIARRKVQPASEALCCTPCVQFQYVLCTIFCTLPCILFTVLLSCFLAAENFSQQYDIAIKIPTVREQIAKYTNSFSMQQTLDKINSQTLEQVGIHFSGSSELDIDSAIELLASLSIKMQVSPKGHLLGDELTKIEQDKDKMLCGVYWEAAKQNLPESQGKADVDAFCSGVLSGAYESPLKYCPDDYAAGFDVSQCAAENAKSMLSPAYFEVRKYIKQYASIINKALGGYNALYGKPTGQKELFDTLRQLLDTYVYELVRYVADFDFTCDVAVSPAVLDLLKAPQNPFKFILINGKTFAEFAAPVYDAVFDAFRSGDEYINEFLRTQLDITFDLYDEAQQKPTSTFQALLDMLMKQIESFTSGLTLPALPPLDFTGPAPEYLVISEVINGMLDGSITTPPTTIDLNLRNIQHVLLSFEDELRAFNDATVFACTAAPDGAAAPLKITCGDSNSAGGIFQMQKGAWNATDAQTIRKFYLGGTASVMDQYIEKDTNNKLAFKTGINLQVVAKTRFNTDTFGCDAPLTAAACQQQITQLAQQYEGLMNQVLAALNQLPLGSEPASALHGLVGVFYGLYADLTQDELTTNYLNARLEYLMQHASVLVLYVQPYLNQLFDFLQSFGRALAAGKVIETYLYGLMKPVFDILWDMFREDESILQMYYTMFRTVRYPIVFGQRAFSAVFTGIWIMYTCALFMPMLAGGAFAFIMRSEEWAGAYDNEQRSCCGCGCCCSRKPKHNHAQLANPQDNYAQQPMQAQLYEIADPPDVLHVAAIEMPQ